MHFLVWALTMRWVAIDCRLHFELSSVTATTTEVDVDVTIPMAGMMPDLMTVSEVYVQVQACTGLDQTLSR